MTTNDDNSNNNSSQQQQITTMTTSNPFEICAETCDVTLKIKDQTLYLHRSILSLYSPVLENMLKESEQTHHHHHQQQKQEKVLFLEEKNVEAVIEFFKYFYPDKLQLTNDETNFHELLDLCQMYDVQWLTDHLEEFLISNGSQDRLFLSNKNIHNLQLADKFNLKTLREKLLSFKSYESFKELQKMDGFKNLSDSTKYEIAKIRIRTQLENKADECNAIIKHLDMIFYHKEPPRIIPIQIQEVKEKQIINPFEKPTKNSDIVVRVQNHELHLHSAVLSLYSPVFQAMLSGHFKEGITKEVHLKEKQTEYVIELFRYLYATQFQKINAQTNFKELLALCDEYQITWLTNHIEDYLTTKVFAKGYDDSKNIWGLQLADRYCLTTLRNKLLSFAYSSYSKLQLYNGFELLANKTKYQIAKQRVKSIFPKVETQQYNIYSKSYVTRWVESEECMAVIQFLDRLFLDA